MPILFTAVFGLVALLAVLLLWVLLGGNEYRRRTGHARTAAPASTPPAPEPKKGEGSDGDISSGGDAE